MTQALVLAAGVGLMVLAGCSRQAPETGTVLARVGVVALSGQDFDRLLKERASPDGAGVDPKAVLQEWVDREVLVQNAVKAGVKEDPKVQEMIRDVLISEYKQRQLVPRLEAVEVTDEELKAAYEAEKSQLITPERVRLAILFLSSAFRAEEEAVLEPRRRLQSALEMARQADAGAVAGAGARKDFGALAASFSEDQETRYRGGDIGWVERERFPSRLDPAVIETGFALTEPGEYSDVILGRDGFYVVKLLDRQAAAPVPLEQAAPALRHKLIEQKKEQVHTQFQAGLREGLIVEIHPDRLQGLHAATAENPPPSIP